MLKKSVFAIALALCLFVSLAAPVFAANATVAVGDADAHPGDKVSVALNLSGNPGISYIRATLEYDESVLTLDEVRNGSILADLDVGRNLLWSANDNATGNGVLATLEFTVSASAKNGRSEIRLIIREAYNSDEKEVKLVAASGGVNVQQPAPKTTEPEKIEYTWNYGDIDGDAEVSAADARLALRLAIQIDTLDDLVAKFQYGYTADGQKLTAKILEQIANVDHDEEVSASDARGILRAAIMIEDLAPASFSA